MEAWMKCPYHYGCGDVTVKTSYVVIKRDGEGQIRSTQVCIEFFDLESAVKEAERLASENSTNRYHVAKLVSESQIKAATTIYY